MRRTGFTLIELLIVIAIIAILALIAVPNFLEAQTRAKVSRVKADMRSIATAVEAYCVDHNVYPLAYVTNNPSLRGGYRTYSSYLKFYNLDFNVYEGTFPLTTPIAYMTSFPEDPFLDKSPAETATSPQNLIDISYLYFNVQGAYDQLQRDSSNFGTDTTGPPIISARVETVYFNGASNTDKSHSYQAAWGLVSPGPSRRVVYPKVWSNGNVFIDRRLLLDHPKWAVLQRGQAATYDPSNGTISLGSIWRLSGGAVE